MGPVAEGRLTDAALLDSMLKSAQRIAPLEKKKPIVLDWLKLPPAKRVPRKLETLARQLAIDTQIAESWAAEVRVEELGVKTHNSRDFFLSKKREIDEGMLKAVGRGNAQMAKIIKQMTGELVEKAENVQVVLTADDYSRLSKRAESELREELPGIREV